MEFVHTVATISMNEVLVMVRMQNWRKDEVERLKKKPLWYLDRQIKDLCQSVECALLNGKFTEANTFFSHVKLYAWAKRKKLKER